MLTLGLIINPLAGIGGAVGLKGSDGDSTVARAFELGAEQKAMQRTRQALEVFCHPQRFRLLTCPDEMGQQLAQQLELEYELIQPGSAEMTPAGFTCPAHTRQAAIQMAERGVDLILFAGGDGTARDICASVPDSTLVLGIPAGVKIHSGVFGVTPTAAGEVVKRLLEGQLVDVSEAEVRDLDEEAFRHGQVKARQFGALRVPSEGHFVQAVKQGGIEDESLSVADIAAWVVEEMDAGCLYFIGSGKTTRAVSEELGVESTLLGVDAVLNGQLLAADINEAGIWELLQQHDQAQAILSVMGGQGHILGRGNQQFSPRILKQMGRENLRLISTKSKLSSVEGRPLMIDSGDPALDRAWSGVMEVVTGYRDQVVYPVAAH
ncbi:MAG: ATP-NAD kinase [Oceanospirillaceae bacterium]|nr:ATP-NAD kinase [Oceanospirillaceae bacterium]